MVNFLISLWALVSMVTASTITRDPVNETTVAPDHHHQILLDTASLDMNQDDCISGRNELDAFQAQITKALDGTANNALRAHSIVHRADVNRDGRICWCDFMAIYLHDRTNEGRHSFPFLVLPDAEMFVRLDMNNDGLLSGDETTHLVNEFASCLPLRLAQSIVNDMDARVKMDGAITLPEFSKYFHNPTKFAVSLDDLVTLPQIPYQVWSEPLNEDIIQHQQQIEQQQKERQLIEQQLLNKQVPDLKQQQSQGIGEQRNQQQISPQQQQQQQQQQISQQQKSPQQGHQSQQNQKLQQQQQQRQQQQQQQQQHMEPTINRYTGMPNDHNENSLHQQPPPTRSQDHLQQQQQQQQQQLLYKSFLDTNDNREVNELPSQDKTDHFSNHISSLTQEMKDNKLPLLVGK